MSDAQPGATASRPVIPLATGGIHTMENHDGAYSVWRKACVSQRLLVHVDAHHDLYGRWIDPDHPTRRARMNIANFLYRALEEDLVREVFWVVPDATWATASGRRDVVAELERLDPGIGRARLPVRVAADHITGSALGRPVHVGPASSLPRRDEEVLLDVDVDYFVVPNVAHRGIRWYGRPPWRWPAELLDVLRARGVRSDLVTVCYSVEGGFTPLPWKFLGDEVVDRLRQGQGPLPWADHLRAATQAVARGDAAEAERHLMAAHAERPGSAAPRWHMARLYAATGRPDAASVQLKAAIAADPTYGGPRLGAGFWYLHRRRHRQAAVAFARATRLDPEDAYARLGAGLLAVRERRWVEAEAALRSCLVRDGTCVDAWRALGEVLARRGAAAEAIAAYERSLKLTLQGHRPLARGVTRSHDCGEGRAWDPEHGGVLARLAELHAAARDVDAAINDARMALGVGGIDRAWVGARLAWLYARRGAIRASLRAAGGAAREVPRSLRRGFERLREDGREAVERWRDAVLMVGASDPLGMWD